jgi:hypothetical protein
MGLLSKPELNGELVVVVGPAPAPAEGRWEVAILGGDRSISLHADKMRLIVPVEERVDMPQPP